MVLRSSAEENRTLINQPSPWGSSLRSSGSSTTASLISTTSPATGVNTSATDVDRQGRSHRRQLRRHVGQPQRLLQRRAPGAARHGAHGATLRDNRMTLARDSPPLHLEADELPRDPLALLRGQGVAAQEVPLVHL